MSHWLKDGQGSNQITKHPPFINQNRDQSSLTGESYET